MIMRGLVDEGLAIVRAARDRHDGSAPQPVERHRVRLLLRPLDVGLAAGQRLLRPPAPTSSPAASASRRRPTGDFRLFWSAGTAFGTVSRPTGRRARALDVLGGTLAGRREIAVDGAGSHSPRGADARAARGAWTAMRCAAAWPRRVAPMATIELRRRPQELPGPSRSIHGIDLAVADGSFTVFVGPSGCGKSTLLRMIAGLEEVTAGEVCIDGARCDHLHAGARAAWRWCSSPTRSTRTCRSSRTCASAWRTSGSPKAEIAARVASAAEILQIGHLLARRPHQLSGGQSQRVAIGRAIVKEPKAFLFDEPLSNLDAELRVRMRGELIALHRRLGATMIYVTHDQVEAMTMADRIVVLHDGAHRAGGDADRALRPAARTSSSRASSARRR